MILVRRQSARAYTLIELVVVVAIIAIIIGLTLPAVQRVRDVSFRSECSNKLHQIGLALHNYHDLHSVLPPGVSFNDGKDPNPFMSWNTRLLPFLERQTEWSQALQAFAQDPRFMKIPPHSLFATVMPPFACPAERRTLELSQRISLKVAFTAYLGVEGINQTTRDGVLYLDSNVRLGDVTDGTSNTLMVGERPPSPDEALGWWYGGEGQNKDGDGDMVLGVRSVVASVYGTGCPWNQPFHFQAGSPSNQCDSFHFWSRHIGGAHFLFADGSVRFLRYSADTILPALATRSGGEPVDTLD